jgi:hypothetical protein
MRPPLHRRVLDQQQGAGAVDVLAAEVRVLTTVRGLVLDRDRRGRNVVPADEEVAEDVRLGSVVRLDLEAAPSYCLFEVSRRVPETAADQDPRRVSRVICVGGNLHGLHDG